MRDLALVDYFWSQMCQASHRLCTAMSQTLYIYTDRLLLIYDPSDTQLYRSHIEFRHKEQLLFERVQIRLHESP